MGYDAIGANGVNGIPVRLACRGIDGPGTAASARKVKIGQNQGLPWISVIRRTEFHIRKVLIATHS